MKLRDTLADGDCPDASARMLAAMLRDPSLVANVRGKVLALDTGRGLLSLSLSSGTAGECYTNSLRTTYLDYAQEELRRLDADFRKDLALLATCGYLLDSPALLDPAEAVRLSQIYSQLYHGKYSRLNPDLTPGWILAAHRSGFLRITILRRPADGLAVGVLGYIVQDGVMTTPLLGYDLTISDGPSLYRLLTARLTLEAEAAGLRMHRSAGADEFKLLRGAKRQIESCAIFTDHLPRRRRVAWQTFRSLVSAVAPLAFR